MKHFVIYIPGLGDKHLYSGIQRASLRLWRTARLQPYYFLVHWANREESYETKLNRLLMVMDDATAKGYVVSLVGASAGASLALTAFARRKQAVSAVVSICGKLHNPGTVNEALFAANPAFKASLAAYKRIEPTLTSADRQKILIARAARDIYVPASDGEVPGATTYRMPSVGHVLSVFMALTLLRRPILRFIARQTQNVHVFKNVQK